MNVKEGGGRGKVEGVMGGDEEMGGVVEMVRGGRKKNGILIGEGGRGKRGIVEGVGEGILGGDVGENVKKKEVY